MHIIRICLLYEMGMCELDIAALQSDKINLRYATHTILTGASLPSRACKVINTRISLKTLIYILCLKGITAHLWHWHTVLMLTVSAASKATKWITSAPPQYTYGVPVSFIWVKSSTVLLAVYVFAHLFKRMRTTKKGPLCLMDFQEKNKNKK